MKRQMNVLDKKQVFFECIISFLKNEDFDQFNSSQNLELFHNVLGNKSCGFLNPCKKKKIKLKTTKLKIIRINI